LSLLACIGGCGGKKTIPGIMERDMTREPLPEKPGYNPRAYEYYSSGTILEMMGEFQLANEQYSKALKYHPESDEIIYAYANTFMRIGDYDSALFQANKIHGRDLKTWFMLANINRALGNRDSSLTAFQQVVALDSNDAQSYYHIATYYRESGNLDSTIWGYENIARINPTFRVFQQLGHLYIQTGDIKSAEENFIQALAIDSTQENIPSYVGLSAIYEDRGDIPGTIEMLEKAAELAPDDARLKERLLEMYINNNQYIKGIEAARFLLIGMPDNLFLKRRLAMMYFDVDSLQVADSIFTTLIENGDDNLVNHYYAGRIALGYEDLERAKFHFTRLTALADSVVDGWLNLGFVYKLQDSVELEIAAYQTGLKYLTNVQDSVQVLFILGGTLEQNDRFDESVRAFEQLIQIAPDHSQALNYLGYMLADKGVRLEYARDLIRRAMEIIPDNGAYIDSYGWVLYKMGKYKKALKELLIAYKLEGNDPVVAEHVGDAYEALGDMKNAHIYWKKALELNPDNQSLVEKLKK